MFKSLIATVLFAAAFVSAKNKTWCVPTVSGQLQLWDFNSTDGVRPMGVNETKAGQFVSSLNVKHHLQVEYSLCQRNDTQYFVGHPQLVVKNNKDLCVGVKRDNDGTGGIFQLQDCASSFTLKHGVNYDIIYGEALKERNATLLTTRYNSTASETLPFVVTILQDVDGGKDKKDYKNVTVAAGENTYSMLQIGNPKVVNRPIY